MLQANLVRKNAFRSVIIGSFVTLAFWSSAALAEDYFGAIAFSQGSGRYGYASDYGSRESAEGEALKECGDSDCTIVLWFKNACAALAKGNDNGYGTGWASTRGEAESIAMSNCNKNSSACSVVRWQCTTR